MTLQNILLPPPPPQEFSGGDASVPRSAALKGLNIALQMFAFKLNK